MGPLKGIRVVEFAGIGPGPFAAMMLADMGADVIRIDRIPAKRRDGSRPSGDLLNRGRRSIALDLKSSGGIQAALRLIGKSDVLLEGFRPGVMERLGLGPDVCMARNKTLIYGRMTGWGQEGPIAHAAGHDINYIALSGVLNYLGREGDAPVPPLNLIGDFGGGGMLLAFGITTALVERSSSGKGQVVDAAMTDGSAILATMVHSLQQGKRWSEKRGTNALDTGSHFYNVYETKDQKFISIGSIEPQFYAELLEKTEISPEELPDQNDVKEWPKLKKKLQGIFAKKTRDEWCEIMEGSDICFAPVLTSEEAYVHPQNVHRETFVSHFGKMQPAPAPRFSRTEPSLDLPPPHPGQHTENTLSDWGFSDEEIKNLRESNTIF